MLCRSFDDRRLDDVNRAFEAAEGKLLARIYDNLDKLAEQGIECKVDGIPPRPLSK